MGSFANFRLLYVISILLANFSAIFCGKLIKSSKLNETKCKIVEDGILIVHCTDSENIGEWLDEVVKV